MRRACRRSRSNAFRILQSTLAALPPPRLKSSGQPRGDTIYAMCRRTASAILLLTGAAAWAERLPIRVYTTADGLASTNLNCIVRDSTGFLWFCTNEGLSRFDGRTFTNYAFADGAAPRPGVGRAAVDFLETGQHELWVATSHALCRFDVFTTSGHPLSDCSVPPTISAEGLVVGAVEAPDGSIWLLQTNGLFRFWRNDHHFELVDLGHSESWTSLTQDDDGSLWIGAERLLAHRLPDGNVERFGEREGMPVRSDHYFRVSTVVRDAGRRLWVATWQGLCLMNAHPEQGKRAVQRVFTTADGLPSDTVLDVFQSRRGKLWVGTEKGLSEWMPESTGSVRFRSYTNRKGFDLYGSDGPALANLTEDLSGNLWMSGPMRLAAHGFNSYGTADGLDSNQIKSVFEDRDGRLIAVSADPRPRHLNVLDGESFRSIRPRLPASIRAFTWGQGQIHFQDHRGAWWIAADGGLCRYPKVRKVEDLAHTLPERVYTTKDGLPGVDIFQLFEDSRGDVWIAAVGSDTVSRWSRVADRIEVFRHGEGGRALGTPIAFAEDRTGNLWMSFYWHDLARYRDGRFEVFTTKEGLPAGSLPTLFVDHAGRLWIASRGQGLVRADDPSGARPQFRFYNVKAGMASDEISCIVEDRWGRIYAGSPHGIDQLDPATGRIRHYGESEGLVTPGNLAAAYLDRQGNLWFGGQTLARFVPEPEDPNPSRPPIRISGIRTHGGPYPMPALGRGRVDGIRLRPGEGAIQIAFASLHFDTVDAVRFQYKLDARGQDWSPPTESPTVDYAGLSAGAYGFSVRAVNAERMTSEAPASVVFVILPPFWQRWWFELLAVAASALAIVGAYKYRLRQALELERVRTRIATDLHDDIGSSLTQIAILSELVRRNGGSRQADGLESLERIGNLSRGLVDSMSDIVWSINPQRDHLGDLEFRMRRFASDMLAPRDIDFELKVPAGAKDIAVDADIRRHIYLIFKECIHNAVRHADCTRVEVTLEARHHVLLLRHSDDGKGFQPPAAGQGHGLANMRRRAAEAGGELQIKSEPGCGTIVTFQVPLAKKSAGARIST
jgi:signal transduction histidine kinase/ligand-binding sensor domain-containing protein